MRRSSSDCTRHRRVGYPLAGLVSRLFQRTADSRRSQRFQRHRCLGKESSRRSHRAHSNWTYRRMRSIMVASSDMRREHRNCEQIRFPVTPGRTVVAVEKCVRDKRCLIVTAQTHGVVAHLPDSHEKGSVINAHRCVQTPFMLCAERCLYGSIGLTQRRHGRMTGTVISKHSYLNGSAQSGVPSQISSHSSHSDGARNLIARRQPTEGRPCAPPSDAVNLIDSVIIHHQ